MQIYVALCCNYHNVLNKKKWQKLRIDILIGWIPQNLTDVISRQAITQANADPDLCRHMVSLGYWELNNK